MEYKKSELNTQLYEKMCEEMKAYEAELLSMPPTEILKHAYAYTTKQDILIIMEEYDLSEKQVEALLKCDNALDAVFEKWEDAETDYMDNIRDMITCTANEKIRDDFLKERREKAGRDR